MSTDPAGLHSHTTDATDHVAIDHENRIDVLEAWKASLPPPVVIPPVVTPPPPPPTGWTEPTGKIVRLDAPSSQAALQAALNDNTVDAVRLDPAGGKYRFGSLYFDKVRTRPIRIAAPPGVILDGTGAGGGAFLFGMNAPAGGVSIDPLTFDNYAIGSTGIIWIGNGKDISIPRMTVTNSRTTTGNPRQSWALYCSAAGGIGVRNIDARGWTVIGAGRNFSGAQVYHSFNCDGVNASGWKVAHLAYALYVESDGGKNIDVTDWTVDDSGFAVGSGPNIAVYFGAGAGKYGPMKLTGSGKLQDDSGGKMVKVA